MGEFKRTNVKVFAKKNVQNTPDTVYWKKFGAPVFLKEFGPIDYIDFSPIEPYYFAVTSSVHVQVYNPVTRLLYKNLSRFQKSAYGGSFRSDGRLLCAGGEENVVKLFDVSTKSLLRVFQGHSGCFFTLENTKIASFSDDRTVALWDIPSEKKLLDFTEHTDYVRGGAVSPASSQTLLSGGYDGSVRLYDARSSRQVLSVDHGAPVEAVLFLPSGGIFLSAGGTEVRVWDCLNAGRLLARLHSHHKTVTCMALGSGGRRLLAGALDRHVSVTDVATWRPLHSIQCPNAIVSLGISAKDETLAVGMVDGLVSVARREAERPAVRRAQRRVTHRWAGAAKPGVVDLAVKEDHRPRLSIHDTLLKKFEHTKALNRVLKPVIVNKSPHVTVAVMQVLLTRRKLHNAVAGGDEKTVLPLLRFLIKYIGDYRFTRVLIDSANVFLDVYEESIRDCGAQAMALFKRLEERLQEEISLTESLLAVQGCVELLAAAATAGASAPQAPQAPPATHSLKPSQSAKSFVVNVS